MMHSIEMRQQSKLIEQFQQLKLKYSSNWSIDLNFARKQKGNKGAKDVGAKGG